jgi:hypothetical protein
MTNVAGQLVVRPSAVKCLRASHCLTAVVQVNRDTLEHSMCVVWSYMPLGSLGSAAAKVETGRKAGRECEGCRVSLVHAGFWVSVLNLKSPASHWQPKWEIGDRRNTPECTSKTWHGRGFQQSRDLILQARRTSEVQIRLLEWVTSLGRLRRFRSVPFTV